MRRADRLFQLIQQLHHDRVVTARDLAATLEVSERTIYRYGQDLSLSGVPISGEAGIGYRLMHGFHIVPDFSISAEVADHLTSLRRAIQKLKIVNFDYIRQDGQHSSRSVHP